MEKKKNLSKWQLTAMIIIAGLNLLWLVCVVLKLNMSFMTFLALLEFAIAAFYVIYGYKKPHGNHMRYLFLFYAVIAAVMLLICFNGQPTYISALYLINIIIVSYMAGRLNRFVQNIIITATVLVTNGIVAFYLLSSIIGSGQPLTFVRVWACFGGVTVWLAIAASYIIRFRPHKEAGLADK